jgi:lipopolysaccharide transport system ATP-binding protein
MTVIRAENVSKAYRIGLAASRNDLRETIMSAVRTPLKRLRKFNEDFSDGNGEDTFWALREVNFDVKQGEVVGIIGRNGAGKSTLLKILSRITEPTQGEVRMKGRVSSLLEVGTGFHPELTGRENVYLNGAILGMKRSEIRSKFDQIVEFSEIGKFLDTPVKRYSSGMYVRLAFAVAAHLDPQILIVDEVLAVGDAAFQKKCLGKMDDVVKQGGRTILFVSHSMDAIAALCSSVHLVQAGRISEKMNTEDGVKQYLGLVGDAANLPIAEKPRSRARPGPPYFTGLNIFDKSGPTSVVPCGQSISFEVQIENLDQAGDGELTCGVALYNQKNTRVALFHTMYHSGITFRAPADGKKRLVCTVPSLPLVPGSYHVELVLADSFKMLERVDRAAKFDVMFADVLGHGKLPLPHQSTVVLPCEWRG